MASTSTTLNVSAGRLIGDRVTLHVRMTGLGWALFRIKLAIPLLWLAARIAGTGFEVDPKTERA